MYAVYDSVKRGMLVKTVSQSVKIINKKVRELNQKEGETRYFAAVCNVR